jgi:hypothetical protein
MKKIISILAVMILSTSSVFAQEKMETRNTRGETVKTEFETRVGKLEFARTLPNRGWFPYMRGYGAGPEFFNDKYKLPVINKVKDFSGIK